MATGLVSGKTGTRTRQPQRPQPPRPQRQQPGPLQRTRPARPQPARPSQPARTAQPGRAGLPQGAGPAAGGQTRPRTPFVLLLVGLLAGGLVCLLMLNTTLAQGAFQITGMQQRNATLSQQVQALQQKTAQEEAPSSIAARAKQLGMRPAGRMHFINLKTGRIHSQPATEPGVVTQPGYTP
ncbi:MAG TPA: hypothetical protein VGM53_26635 [Streptosporangiaceae bacterium]